MGSAHPRLGKYQLVGLLGCGGMAEVWRARVRGAAGFERTVVVKRILPHLARQPRFVTMFLDEAKLSARLHHPNIVQVNDLGEVDGEYFMAMEYVEGHDLVKVLQKLALAGRRVPVGMAAFIAHELCRALAYAHALTDDDGRPLQLVHRDVSPSNVLLGRNGQVKLLDFGIAKALAVETEIHTDTGMLKGKLGYMSPQHIEGRPIDHRADLFAVGVILHELLAMRRLFKGANEFDTMQQVRAARVEPPSAFNPEVPPELDALCLRALARDPRRRHERCDELAEALAPFAASWNGAEVGRLLDELFPRGEASVPEPADSPLATATGLSGEQSARTEPSVATPRPRVRMSRWVAMVAALFVVSAAGVVVVKRKLRAAAAPPAVVEAPVVAPIVAAAPSTVRVVVQSEPAQARVLFGDGEGEERAAPATLEIPSSTKSLRIRVLAPGYQTYETRITAEANAVVRAVLRPLPPPVAPVVAKTRPTKPAPLPKRKPPARKTRDFDPESALPL